MMLASTMQFSKYGRSRPQPNTYHPKGKWFDGKTGPERYGNASVPSGPNSVPSQLIPAARVPPAQVQVY